MSRVICVLVVLAVPQTPILVAADTDEIAKEFTALRGKWKTVAGEAGGMPFPKDGIPDFTITISPTGKCTGQTPKDNLEFTITIDPKKDPKTIETMHTGGAQKGKKQYGIYKLEGDKFTVCMTRPGSAEGDRPKDFNTKGTANVVFVFERVKEDKKP